MSTQRPPTLDTPRAEAVRAEAERLLREGLSGYDIAVALHIDVAALRRLLGFCEDCE